MVHGENGETEVGFVKRILLKYIYARLMQGILCYVSVIAYPSIAKYMAFKCQ